MLITPEYQAQQQEMHRNIPHYGHVGERYGPLVGKLIDDGEIETVLDYGCGHNLSLKKSLKANRPFTYQCYDPGVPEYADPPEPAQLVCCIDVLEHIEPDCLESVLDHLEELTQLLFFGTIHTKPATKTLPDGRNAHLIQQPWEWWGPKLEERFTIQSMQKRGSKGYEFIASNKDADVYE